MVTCEDILISFIWVETQLDLLAAALPADAPLAFLGRFQSYTVMFDAAKASGTTPQGLDLPWPRPTGQRFWTFFLEGTPPGRVTAREAWRHFVPFRRRIATKAKLENVAGRLYCEAFFHPHGVAAVATARLQLQANIDATSDVCKALRRSATLDDGAGKLVNLDTLADRLLVEARTLSLGPTATIGKRSPEPFSCATVVRARTDALSDVKLRAGGSIEQFLETITRWPSLEAGVAVPVKGNRLDGIDRFVYATSRGRAIWFPDAFLKSGGKSNLLSCYHRNLVLSALQVESLTGLVRHSPANPAPTHENLLNISAGLLGRIYSGADNCYKSRSASTQIDHSGILPSLNRLRAANGMAPLP